MKRLLRQGACLAALLAPITAHAAGSGITGITVAGRQDVGTFNAVPYVRTWGTVSGVVAPGEKVAGLAALPKDAQGDYAYVSGFEVIAPARPGANATVLVEAENRGSPLMLDNLNHISVHGVPAKVAYPHGLGTGFLEDNGISYARIDWQTGIAPGVPAAAQGVGEVILRDFARLLGGARENLPKGQPGLGHDRTLLLGGISQSAWFIDTFIAEGFNADPKTGTRVFNGALAIDGTGNWLALNRLAQAHHAAEAPYFAPNPRPLTARQLLSRPESDPFYVDVANYTDFYRVHASLTDTADLPVAMRRYDWQGPHHPITTPADARVTFSPTRPGGACNNGVTVPLNPVSYTPFLRTLVVELAHQVGSPDGASAPGLPPTTLFRLGPAPQSTAHFNPLTGAALQVPLTGAQAQPVGGVRFPATVVPLGKPTPVALPPVITSAITGTCGNIGEWQPLTKAEITQRYGSAADFLNADAQAINRLVAAGYLLASQRGAMLSRAGARYVAATGQR
ncbi:MAG: alpha/beta hydrolase domain-containing protein [Acetobacteraceae bacterium]